MSIKVELIKLGAEVLTKCPVSPYLSDMDLPYKIGKMNARHIQGELMRLDRWLKSIAIKTRELADSIDEDGNTLKGSIRDC